MQETLELGERAAEDVEQKGGVLFSVLVVVVGQEEVTVRAVYGVRMLLEELLSQAAHRTMAPQV